MATSSSFTPFCTLASRVKGDHVYQANPKINDKCDCKETQQNRRDYWACSRCAGKSLVSTADGQKDFCVLHNHRTIKGST